MTESPDYNLRFHAAVAHAFSSSDAAVRRAYLDLADFYRAKLGETANMYPAAHLLKTTLNEG